MAFDLCWGRGKNGESKLFLEGERERGRERERKVLFRIGVGLGRDFIFFFFLVDSVCCFIRFFEA